MEKRYLAPKDIAKAMISVGVSKSNLSLLKMALLGILAGVFISFGAYGDIVIMQTLKNIDVGLMKFAGSVIFPIGLMLVLMCGAELFTGNNLMSLALFDKKITLSSMLKNWIMVYIFNFVGSLILALVIVKSGLLDATAGEMSIGIAKGKMALDWQSAFLRGILCNMLVCLGVWMACGAQDVISKIFSCWFPVMLFVLSGYEHSVANMFFLPAAKFIGFDVSYSSIIFNNLVPVTLGNIVGGGIILPGIYYISYIRQEKVKENAKL